MGPPPKPSEAGSVGRGGPAEGMSFRVYAEANDPQLGPTMWGATTRRAVRLPGCLRGAGRFFEGGFAGFLSEAPPAPPTRRAHRFLSERKRWERKGRGCAPGAPQKRGLMAAVGCTELAKTGSASPPAPLALAVIGAPAEAQRSGFGRERRPSGGNELSGLPGSERSVAWADDAAPWAARIAVTPQTLKAAALYRPDPPGRRRCGAPERPGCLRRLCESKHPSLTTR